MSRASSKSWLLVDLELRTAVVRGPDRLSWLNSILSCEVASLSPGQGRWGLLLNKQGKVQSEVLLLAGKEVVYLGLFDSAFDNALSQLDRMLVMEDAELEPAATDLKWLRIYGDELPGLEAKLASHGTHGRLCWGARPGACCVVPAGDLDGRLAEFAGEKVTIAVVHEPQAEALRIEWELPRFGVDYNSQHNPHEASLERRAVDWDKGCYLGQEVVCMQDMRGKVKSRLVVFATELSRLPAVEDENPRRKRNRRTGDQRCQARTAWKGVVFRASGATPL